MVGHGGSRNNRSVDELLGYLEELAGRASMTVRYVSLEDPEFDMMSGSCVLKGEHTLLIDRSLQAGDRIKIILCELARVDITDLYIRPAVRDLIERAAGDRDQKRFP